MDYSPPGSSVHGILQTRIPERLPPGDLPDPGIEPLSPGAPALQEGFFLLLSHGGSPVVLLSRFKQISPWAHTYLFFPLSSSLPAFFTSTGK